jgi:hypothetical protein
MASEKVNYAWSGVLALQMVNPTSNASANVNASQCIKLRGRYPLIRILEFQKLRLGR